MKRPLTAYLCCKGVCGLYQIIHNDSIVGSAEMTREGLFYRICCTCKITEEGIHRIKVCDGEDEVDLGICVPRDDVFGLTSRVPVKAFKGECPVFHLIKQGQNKTKTEEKEKIPVASGKPFPSIEQLENAYFMNCGGNPAIVIDPVPDQQGSDQSP